VDATNIGDSNTSDGPARQCKEPATARTADALDITGRQRPRRR